MATFLTLAAELQQMKEYMNTSSAPVAENAATQTTKLQSVEKDLRLLYEKADEAIRPLSIKVAETEGGWQEREHK